MWVMVYYKYWAVPNVPKAIINRRGGVLPKDTWAGRIYEEFAQTTTINIAFNVTMTLLHVK